MPLEGEYEPSPWDWVREQVQWPRRPTYRFLPRQPDADPLAGSCRQRALRWDRRCTNDMHERMTNEPAAKAQLFETRLHPKRRERLVTLALRLRSGRGPGPRHGGASASASSGSSGRVPILGQRARKSSIALVSGAFLDARSAPQSDSHGRTGYLRA